MNNPLVEEKPEGLIQQVHAYARDLAYLCVMGEIDSEIPQGAWGWFQNPHVEHANDSEIRQEFRRKWGDANSKLKTPSFDLLTSFGYMGSRSHEVHNEMFAGGSSITTTYTFTPEAFDLLNQPIVRPSIFVSYKRAESSAFALLIEARLRLKGVDTVFLDKNILAGVDWQEHIKNTVNNCDTFICLIGKTTLDSEMVLKEINWAAEHDCNIISIWHNQYDIAQAKDNCPEVLAKRNAIKVKEESAKDYESAINELLNSLGYATY